MFYQVFNHSLWGWTGLFYCLDVDDIILIFVDVDDIILIFNCFIRFSATHYGGGLGYFVEEMVGVIQIPDQIFWMVTKLPKTCFLNLGKIIWVTKSTKQSPAIKTY